MNVWLVFKQDTPKKPHQMVGSVHASDGEMALLQARTVFVRRPKAVSLWVAAVDDAFTVTLEGIETLGDAPDSDDNETWHLFRKTGQRRSMTFVDRVGAVKAGSAVDAIHQAIGSVSDDKTTWAWMAVPESVIYASEPDDVDSWFTPALDKKYKQQSQYGFVGKRRAKAHE